MFAPVALGLGGAAALILMYVGILSAAESFGHARDQFRADAPWVLLVAAGFGTQVGLFWRIRQLTRAQTPAGAKALTGAGTGSSAAGMIACCAHHLADIAPFIGLTGATAFLSQYRLAFIAVGLLVNAVGIGHSVRTLQKVLAAAE